jgi:hypothetical protein
MPCGRLARSTCNQTLDRNTAMAAAQSLDLTRASNSSASRPASRLPESHPSRSAQLARVTAAISVASRLSARAGHRVFDDYPSRDGAVG